LTRATKGARWSAVGTLYGNSRAQARADRKRVRAVLRRNVDRLFFIDGTIARIAGLIRRPYRWLTGIDLGPIFDTLYNHSVYLGVPTSATIASTYWRKKQPPPPAHNLDRDRCGVIFFSPLIPCDGQHARTAVQMIEETVHAHGFEPVMNLSYVQERSIHIVLFLLYDRDVKGEDERALACHDALVAKLSAAGYLPYRLDIHTMHQLPPSRDDHGHFIEALKAALDPNGILAPGRYDA
jgi:4-cresol dehydrogenase (hydroxylating)